MKFFLALFVALILLFAGSADAVSPAYVGVVSAQSNINSIQQVSITIGAGETSHTATINAVSAIAFPVFQGFQGSDTSFSATIDFSRVELTNSTTVTAYRNTSDAAKTVTVRAVIVDPSSTLVQSVQLGTITITAGTSNTATISSVDTSRSAVFYLGDTSANVGISTSNAGLTLTNSTTVTASLNASGTATAGYAVVQFRPYAIKSLQQFSSAFTSASAADTQAITSVNTSNSMIAYGGQTSPVSGSLYWDALTNATTITLTRNGTAIGSRTPYYAVIEFNPGILRSRQGGGIDLTNVTTNTATISSVNTSRTFCSYLGNLSSAITEGAGFSNISLTNATTVTAARSTGNSSTNTPGYGCPEFN